MSLIEKNSEYVEKVRKLGDDAGIVFPDEAPAKTSNDVPREGHKLTDQLSFSSSRDILPRPDIRAMVESAQLTEAQAERVVGFIDNYRQRWKRDWSEADNASPKCFNPNPVLLEPYLFL